MGNPTFYWYDYETFGLEKDVDRPSQFAGQRTDMDFNPIGEGEVFYDKPSLDYLPSAQSCLLTGITPQTCMEEGIPESDFAQKVWDRFNEPGTISLGYNTLGFDDDVSRFLFWRNFLDPYSHQWQNGCSRWDIFPLVCAVWALRGDNIQWPRWEDINKKEYPAAEGREGVCFKLEFLTKANGITHAHAHNALSDVSATIGLAKKIAETEPKLWKWALENRSKEAVKEALKNGPVLWVHPRFGQKRGFSKIVNMIANNQQKRNEVFVWDLAYDPTEFANMTREELVEHLFPSKEKREAGVKPLPIYRLPTNGAPFVCGNLKVLSDARAEFFGIDKELAMANLEKLTPLLPMLQGPLMDFSERAPLPTPIDVDQALYSGGFPSEEDRARCQLVRQYSPAELAREVRAGNLKFDDERYNELLFRFRARNWPESLSDEEAQEWKSFCAKRVLTEKGDGVHRTVTEFFNEVDTFQEIIGEDEELMNLMDMLYAWGEYVGEMLSVDGDEEADGPDEA